MCSLYDQCRAKFLKIVSVLGITLFECWIIAFNELHMMSSSNVSSCALSFSIWRVLLDHDRDRIRISHVIALWVTTACHMHWQDFRNRLSRLRRWLILLANYWTLDSFFVSSLLWNPKFGSRNTRIYRTVQLLVPIDRCIVFFFLPAHSRSLAAISHESNWLLQGLSLGIWVMFSWSVLLMQVLDNVVDIYELCVCGGQAACEEVVVGVFGSFWFSLCFSFSLISTLPTGC